MTIMQISYSYILKKKKKKIKDVGLQFSGYFFFFFLFLWLEEYGRLFLTINNSIEKYLWTRETNEMQMHKMRSNTYNIEELSWT